MNTYVTWTDLIQFCLLIVGIIALFQNGRGKNSRHHYHIMATNID